jgi:hypothetical protein
MIVFRPLVSISVDIPDSNQVGEIDVLFSEEAGLVIEVSAENMDSTIEAYTSKGFSCVAVGAASPGDSMVTRTEQQVDG